MKTTKKRGLDVSIVRQAIVTRYLGPSNRRGSRIRAVAQAGSLLVAWDDGLDPQLNHAQAANALADRYGWLKGSDLVGGALPQGGYCFILIPRT